MNYIVCKKFDKKVENIQFDLLKGATLIENNNKIYYNNEFVCYKTSQYAYDYLSRNDDNKGFERFNKTRLIIDKIQNYVIEYNENYSQMLNSLTEDMSEEDKQIALQSVVDVVSIAYEKIKIILPEGIKNENIFTSEFYNAEIDKLNEILEVL